MVGLWIIVFMCCVIEPSPVKGRGKFSAKLPGIWEEIVKMPHEAGCPLHMISKIDDDNSLRDVRVEIFKEEFLKKLGLKERPNLSDSDNAIPGSAIATDVIRRTLNISSITPNDAVPDGEKVIIVPKGYSITERQFNVLMDLPAHLMSENIKSAQLWMYPNKTVRDISFPKMALVASASCGNTTRKPSWSRPKSISIADGWFQVDLTSIVKNQLEYQELCSNVTIDYEPGNRVRKYSFSQNSEHRPFLLVRTESSSKPDRDKRDINCGHNSTDCCRENLTISFSDINWSQWIIYPHTYNAFYCKGSCSRATSITLNTYYTLTEKRKQLLTEKGRKNLNVKPCCVPTKFSSMSVAYKVDKNTAVTKTVPDMIIESCGCM